MGYGLIKCEGSRLTLVEMGVLRLSANDDAYKRLQNIHTTVKDLISRFRPHDFAIEAPFFGKNVQSMLKLGRAQGVAIATAMHAGLPVTEYSPRKVKQSITGRGNSEKEQVWKMLAQILRIEQENPSYDASDALAVAVCHHFQANLALAAAIPPRLDQEKKGGAPRRKKPAGWDAFIRENPDKVFKKN
jgi:crossover junction endodeoxyribonuclease RuvC